MRLGLGSLKLSLSLSLLPVFRDCTNNFFFGLSTVSQVERPLAARVERVPLRPPLIPASPPWIIVAKSVNDNVPDRLILGDEHLFRQSDPNRIENQPATRELAEEQVLRRFD
ncbi:MAG: hypothetical protein OXI41_12585 [Chloroflexota bacterium]|nr:hypothetical protein [Chloroflexota bacterium]MDE2894366.1 hypothetical protein [Chloroflexota bacterium]